MKPKDLADSPFADRSLAMDLARFAGALTRITDHQRSMMHRVLVPPTPVREWRRVNVVGQVPPDSDAGRALSYFADFSLGAFPVEWRLDVEPQMKLVLRLSAGIRVPDRDDPARTTEVWTTHDVGVVSVVVAKIPHEIVWRILWEMFKNLLLHELDEHLTLSGRRYRPPRGRCEVKESRDWGVKNGRGLWLTSLTIEAPSPSSTDVGWIMDPEREGLVVDVTELQANALALLLSSRLEEVVVPERLPASWPAHEAAPADPFDVRVPKSTPVPGERPDVPGLRDKVRALTEQVRAAEERGEVPDVDALGEQLDAQTVKAVSRVEQR